MMLRLTAIVALALATAACVPGETTATGAGQPATTTAAMPGSNIPDVATIANHFARVCGQTAPDFSQAPSLLAAMPFALNISTGVYLHRNLNLSFKIKQKECSMVFRSSSTDATIHRTIAKALGTKVALIDGETHVSLAPGPGGTILMMGPMGQSYHRAILETQ